MATVLTASLSSNRSGNGDISVAIMTSFSGKGVCNFQLPGQTLGDLQKVLCDPQGPMFWCYPWSRLLFYTEDEPLRPLDMNLQLDAFDSLVIKRWDMEACLERYPHIGKFLDAMCSNKFDPRSAKFDAMWTARSAPTVPADEAEAMVHEVLSGWPIHADSELHFVRIFGELTALGETWEFLHLRLQQNYDPGLRRFKHCVSNHWLEVARFAATSVITEAPPILLLKRGSSGCVIGCGVIGDAFPDNFDAKLTQSLQLLGLSPNVHWRNVSHVLVSLDWNPQEGLATLEHLLTKIKQEPCEFAALAHPEVSKMVHVQLRLSFFGVAEVKGPINETCVKILAELLDYKLKTVKFQSVQELQIEIGDFEAEANYRGTLVLVTDVPASAGKILRGPHRMVLCYGAE